MMRTATATAVLLAAALGATACAAEEPAYRHIEPGLETLRAAFNAQPDHVRAVLLASPT